MRQANHPDIDTYLSFLDRFDTRRHVARHTGRLLIQHGLQDESVTIREAHPPARQDRNAFLLHQQKPSDTTSARSTEGLAT